MGRKGSWFSTVKKVFSYDVKKDQKQKQNHRSKLSCFGHYHPDEDLERTHEGVAIAVVPSLPRRKNKNIKTRSETESEQNKQTLTLALATAMAAGAAVAAAQAVPEVAAAQAAPEVAPLTNESHLPSKIDEEVAAIKIQTAYRGYLARRSLRGLRGWARLKTLVQGQSVQRQAAVTLQNMQTISRLQSQVRARNIKMAEENQALQRQMQRRREKELEKLQSAQVGEKWDDSSHSKEQVEAKLLYRQVAAMRREKALAYASTHQQTWRNPSKSAANATFMDPNNPHWGWNWLERWMAARPWEGQNTTYQNNHAPINSAASQTMTVSQITKLYSLRDQNHDSKNTPPSPKAIHARSQSTLSAPASKAPPSTNGTKAKGSTSPKRGGSWGGFGDSKSMPIKNSASNRRHSIAVSPVKDDENHGSSSPTLSSHTTTPSTKGIPKPKSKVQSPSPVVQRNGTPEKLPKQKLSLPASSAGSRRLSIQPKVGSVISNKNVATNSEEKVKVKRVGGSR